MIEFENYSFTKVIGTNVSFWTQSDSFKLELWNSTYGTKIKERSTPRFVGQFPHTTVISDFRHLEGRTGFNVLHQSFRYMFWLSK